MGVRHLYGYISNPIAGNTAAVFGPGGYPTVSAQIVGTFSSGSYTPQVSSDGGQTWSAIPAISAEGILTSTITATGVYRFNVNAFPAFRLNPSSAAGSHQIYLFASEEPVVLGDRGTGTEKYAAVSASSSGNNTLVAAVTGKKIRVLSGALIAAGSVTVQFQSGAGGTNLTGAMPLTTSTGFVIAYVPVGNFETAAGALLNLSLGGAVAVTGWLVYQEV